MIEQEDSNAERSSEVHRGVEELACYKALHDEKKKAAVQLRLDMFFSKVEKQITRVKKNNHPLLQPLSKTHNLFHWVRILL
jgi:hypothetical protein